MGNCMNKKNSTNVTEPQKIPQELLARPMNNNQEQEQSSNEEQKDDFQIVRSVHSNQDDVVVVVEKSQNQQQVEMNVIQADQPKKQLTGIALFRQQQRMQKQQQTQSQTFKPLFEYLINLAQEAEPKEIDMAKMQEIMKEESHINKCILEKEFSGLTIMDYCFQNQHIYLLRFLIQRVDLEAISNKKEELANMIFKALISSSKQFNRMPQFFFNFLDLIQESQSLGELFSIYLENANPSCFLQYLGSDSAQQFLEKVKELITISIEQDKQQKEIDLLSTVTKIQNNFYLEEFFVKVKLPNDLEVLKMQLNEGNLKLQFDDRQFNLAEQKIDHKAHCLSKYYYTFAHHISLIKRFDLFQDKWDIYMPLLLEKDSGRNSAASIILKTAPYEVIEQMVEAFKNNTEQLCQVTNNKNQNIFHFVLQNKNLNDKEILKILNQLLKLDDETKEKLLASSDNENNIPLTLYLKRQRQSNKDISLIEYLLPTNLSKKIDQTYPHLQNLDFPLWEYQYQQQLSIPSYLWRLYPKLKSFQDTIDSLNNQIIISALALENQRKEIFDVVGSKLNFALVKNGYEQYLMRAELKLAEKCLIDQQSLDESRQKDISAGRLYSTISYLQEQSYVSQKKYFVKIVQNILLSNYEPESALDLVVTTKLRQELNQIQIPNQLQTAFNEQFDNIFNLYVNRVEYLTKLSHSRIFHEQQNIPFYTFSKITALKNELYYNRVSEALSNQGLQLNTTFEANRMRMQVIMLNLSKLEYLANFDSPFSLSIAEKNDFIQILKTRIKSIRNFTNLVPFIINKIGYQHFVNYLNKKIKKRFLTILSELFFKVETPLNKIAAKETKQQIIHDVLRSDRFKKVLGLKGINNINLTIDIVDQIRLMQVVFEVVKLKDKDQWNFYKDYYYNRLNKDKQEKEKEIQLDQKEGTQILINDIGINKDELKSQKKLEKKNKIIHIQKNIDLSSQRDIKYYQENAKRILFGLIHCNVFGKIGITVPCKTMASELIKQLQTATSPYLHFFSEIITTNKKYLQCLFSHQKYLEILQQITPDKKFIVKESKDYLFFALQNNNLPAIKWAFSTIFPPNIKSDNSDESENIILRFTDLNLKSLYSSRELIQINEINEENRVKREIQWEIFSLIYQRFQKDITTPRMISKDVIKLYENFGNKFSIFSIQSDVSLLSIDYIHLMKVVRLIYVKHGEQAIHSNRNIKYQYFQNDQIEVIVHNYLNRLIEIYNGPFLKYSKGDEQSHNEKEKFYYQRKEIILTLEFFVKKLLDRVVEKERIQRNLLELSHSVLAVHDDEVFKLILDSFCLIIKQAQDHYKCASAFIDSVVYPYFLEKQINQDDDNYHLELLIDLPPLQEQIYASQYLNRQEQLRDKFKNRKAYQKSKSKIAKDNKSQLKTTDKDANSILEIYGYLNGYLVKLIQYSLISHNEGLLLILIKVVALLSYKSKSLIEYFFKLYVGSNYISKNKNTLFDYEMDFQNNCAIFFNRYLNVKRFEVVIKLLQAEKQRKFSQNNLLEENKKRYTFLVENILKDTARYGQSEKWDILAITFHQEISSNLESVLVTSCVSAFAGYYNLQLDLEQLNRRQKFSYNRLKLQLRSMMMDYLMLGYSIENAQDLTKAQNYASIISSIMAILNKTYSKRSEAITFYTIKGTVKDRDFSSLTFYTTLNILFLSSLFYFDQTFTFVKYLHNKIIVKAQEDSDDKDNCESYVKVEEQPKAIWDLFIKKSLFYGAMRYSSSWDSLQLKQFLEEFNDEYIELINQYEEEVKSDYDKNEFYTLNLSSCAIYQFQSSDHKVNQEYIQFLIRNKDKINKTNLLIIQILLDQACRQFIQGEGENKTSRNYILDAMKSFDMKFNHLLQQKVGISTSSFNFKHNLDLKSISDNIEQHISYTNNIADYMVLLSDEELEYALKLGLFFLSDHVTPKYVKQKLVFLTPREKETESEDDDHMVVSAARYSLMIGRMHFIQNHSQAIIETVRLTTAIRSKLARCAYEALLSGKLEVFLFFFNKLKDTKQQIQFLLSEQLLFQMVQSMVGTNQIYSYLMQNFYCNLSVINQHNNGRQLFDFEELISDKCMIFKNLAMMGQEETLLDIFSYLFKHYDLSDQQISQLKESMNEMNSYRKGKNIKDEDNFQANVYDIFSLFQMNNLLCFLYENNYRPVDNEYQYSNQIHDVFSCNYSKEHQINYLEKQGLAKATKSRSELYSHLIIVLKFLIQEFTSYQIDFSALQMIEDVLFGFNYPQNQKKVIYKCLTYFSSIQFTGGFYIFCEIFKNIDLRQLINQTEKLNKLQRSEVFNIYLLKHSIYPDIDIHQVIDSNQSYFKSCRLAKFIKTLKDESIMPSIDYLSKQFNGVFEGEDQIGQQVELLVGEEKYEELRNLIQKIYYQKEFIKIICAREKEFITTDEQLFRHIILQDTHLTIFLLKDNPLSEKIIKQFEVEINDNKNQFKDVQEDCQVKSKDKKKSEFSMMAAAEFESQSSDSPFNKILRSLVYYFAVQRGNSIIDIYDKVFSSINIFSKQGISFQYHLAIIKSSPQNEQQQSDKVERKAKIDVVSVQKIVEQFIYSQLIQANENFQSKSIQIKFNNIFEDIVKYATKPSTFYEKQYLLIFQTIFRFFQTIYSLHLIDNYPDKSLEISLIMGNEPIVITQINQQGLKVSLYYSYTNSQFTLNVTETQPLIDQIEDFYFSEKNMPFIEQQIELFNNHKDKLIRSSQFGEIPFEFLYQNIEDLPLEFKKEILNQVQLRSQEALKSAISQQMSIQNSSSESKKEYFCDSNTYFGLFSLVEDISMFLSFLNVNQNVLFFSFQLSYSCLKGGYLKSLISLL